MIRIITTEDGSHSLFDEKLNETYHSTRGARGESLHVFIKEGLEYFLSQNLVEEVRILEVGLGTGLNAFLTAQFAEKNNQKIQFTSLEPFPITKEIYERLNFSDSAEEKKLLSDIHDSDWEKDIELTQYFRLHKTVTQLEHFSISTLYHLVYFDAFAPSKQPEVWSLDNLKKCYDLLESDGVLTTYCAQGQFKRNLTEAGFKIETLQGAMGKKEMVRGER
ncbi:MAG: tRNA (5-methylaminomethyl-2-thiouridine)(34)-methyltransferase MnmD [Bacteroidota bacterium]